MPWSPELESQLVMAMANVLVKFGIHKDDADECEGWLPEQVAEVMELMESQVQVIEAAK